MQVLLVQLLGNFADTTKLSWQEWLICIALGFVRYDRLSSSFRELRHEESVVRLLEVEIGYLGLSNIVCPFALQLTPCSVVQIDTGEGKALVQDTKYVQEEEEKSAEARFKCRVISSEVFTIWQLEG